MSRKRMLRWQSITLSSLFVGYAGYYICRSNLAVSVPLMLEEYRGDGLTKTDLGAVASIGVLFYAIGKVVNGLLADRLGGARVFIFGMLASVFCTFAFALVGGMFGALVLFGVIWAGNRFVQSMGWVALVKTAGRWFPLSLLATIMAILSTSYLIGDSFAKWYLGIFIESGVGWRGIFYIAGGTLLVIAVANWLFLKSSPKDIGEVETEAHPDSVFGADDEQPRRWTETLSLIVPFLRNPVFWLICIMNVGLTTIRETFNFWTPTYFTSLGMSAGEAAQYSSIFPLVGAASVLLAGFGSDLMKGKHGRIILPAILLMAATLWLLSWMPLSQNHALALVLTSCVSFFLLAPYSYFSGVMAVELGGKKGSSTAAGLIDSAGYMGAVLSGIGIGWLAEEYGWSVAFGTLAALAGLTAIAGAVYWIRQEIFASGRA